MVLNEKSIAALKVGKKREQYFDDKQPGFGVRVEANGRKSFYWYAKVHGKPRFKALGEFPVTPLKEARDEAADWTSKAAAWKKAKYLPPDPFEKVKPAPVVVAPTVPTFQAMLDAYITNHVRKTANQPDDAEHRVRWMSKRYFGAWLEMPIDQITVEHVLAVKNGLGEKVYQANRCVELIKRVYNWASANGENGKVRFWNVLNPARNVELHDEEARKVFLEPEQLAQFNDALKDEPNADLRDFLVLALATGARRGNIYSMAWSNISWERLVWHVPVTKNGESYDVQLTRPALDVLKRRRQLAPEDATFVFPADSKSGHVFTMDKVWHVFRKRAGIEHIRLHDVRHTSASYLAMSGASLQTIGAALGHKSLQSTAVYAHLIDEAVRDARESGEKKMFQMMNAAKKRTKKLAAKKSRPMLKAAEKPALGAC